MADIQTSLTTRSYGVKKFSKSSTRVDLTPMVDLGFLLITFFVFTTTMAQPTAMKLVLPDDEKTANPMLAPASQTITFLLGANNTLFYYEGFFNGALNRCEGSTTGFRSVLQRKVSSVNRETKSQNKTIVLIKATPQSTFRNVVDALDEMVINGVTRYVLLDASPEERDFLAKK